MQTAPRQPDSTSMGLEFPNEYRKHRQFNGNNLALYSGGKERGKKKRHSLNSFRYIRKEILRDNG